MPPVLQDVGHAIRQLRRRPIYTATAVVTLAIGMGVNAVAFGVVNGLLFKGYAMSGIPGTGRILTTPGGDESGYASIAEYQRLSDATVDVLDSAAEGRLSLSWKHDNTTEPAWALFVSRRYFSLITPPVVAGRLEVSREADMVSAVIGERFWREKLGARSLAGLTLRLNNTDVSVAGVVAATWTGPAGIYSPDVWLPLDELALFGTDAARQRRDDRWLFMIGRLRDAATPAQVEALVAGAAAQMARDWPDTHHDRSASFRMFTAANSELKGIAYGAAIGMAVIGLVLLLACFNVANLLLAQGVERERDMGIRSALGANPGRLMRLVITEGGLLAVMAGALALVLASWTQSLVGSFAMPIDEPQHIDLSADWRVIAFIGVLVLIAGVLPGIWPALAAARVNLVRVLGSQGNGGGARPSALRRWLISAQVAGSTAFLAIATLFLQSYQVLTTFDVGFARDRLVVADVAPTASGYSPERARQYVRALAERISALPGVERVAIADRAPFFIGFDRTAAVTTAPQACADATCPKYPIYTVGPGYFETMGIAIAAGREFTAASSGSEVVINDVLAKTLWSDGDAIGRAIRIGDGREPAIVVGVTGKTRTRGLDRETAVLFVPLTPSDFDRPMTLVTRTAASPSSLVQPIRDAAHEADPDVAPYGVKTMDERMAVQLWPFRTLTWLFSICGALALLLAIAGLAGMVIHGVNRRVREFGVRLSIGAAPRDLAIDVVRGSVQAILPGLAAGVLLGAAAARLVRFMFIGVNVLNPATYVAIALLQVTVVAIACLAPAIRAARVDPLTALRAE